jgi:hypothetical protein
MCWAINWTVLPCLSGGFRLQRRVHRGPGILVPEEIPDDQTREAELSTEALADARAALEPAWTTPPQEWAISDCSVTWISSGERSILWYGLPLRSAFIAAIEVLEGVLVTVGAEAFHWPVGESPQIMA